MRKPRVQVLTPLDPRANRLLRVIDTESREVTSRDDLCFSSSIVYS